MSKRGRLEISEALRRSVTDLGSDAEGWLEGIPALIARVANDWQLEVGPPLRHGGVASIILPVTTRDGTAAFLKLSVPHDESRHEADALRRWDGNGAVKLLRSSEDGFTLLLERCLPGHDLWQLSIEEQIEVMADLLPRLWASPQPDDPFHELALTSIRWERQMLAKAQAMGVSDEVGERACGWARELRESQPRRLLHGDFHPGNILAAERGPWLVIDPKPWVGDPAFDLAQILYNWVDADATGAPGTVDAIRHRAAQLSDRLSLDVDRVLLWAVVKAIGWDFGREATLVLDGAARRR